MNLKVLCVLPLILAPAFCTAAPAPANGKLFVEYEEYDAVLDCARHGAEIVHARIGHDMANINRKASGAHFYVDPKVDASCEQKSAYYYPKGYHRGHLFGANQAENSLAGYLQTFSMVNILPMTRELNVGAWARTEEIEECLRDRAPIDIWAGPIWDGSHSNMRTVKTHGVKTPSAFWKVIKQGPYQIAWIIPNSKEPHKDTLPSWESTVEEIEKAIGFEINGNLDLYQNKRPDSWYSIKGCDLS